MKSRTSTDTSQPDPQTLRAEYVLDARFGSVPEDVAERAFERLGALPHAALMTTKRSEFGGNAVRLLVPLDHAPTDAEMAPVVIFLAEKLGIDAFHGGSIGSCGGCTTILWRTANGGLMRVADALARAAEVGWPDFKKKKEN